MLEISDGSLFILYIFFSNSNLFVVVGTVSTEQERHDEDTDYLDTWARGTRANETY